MDELKMLNKLIDAAVFDDARKQLYHDALPKMTAEEKLELGMFLWTMMMDKIDQRIMGKMEAMVEEMAKDGSTTVYEKKDFKAVEDQEITEFLKEQLGEVEEEELAKLRSELNFIGEKVKEHDEVISKLKDKV
jgi:hypothetical protein